MSLIVDWPLRGDVPVNDSSTEDTSRVPAPHCFQQVQLIFLAPREPTITAGYYFKCLIVHGGGQFAKHPQFRYFALNTEMGWHALQTGRIFIKQHPKDTCFTLDQLWDMVNCEEEIFTSRILHYASSSYQSVYWFKQRSRLIAIVNTLKLPTGFCMHSAADAQWPELTCLICPDNPDCTSAQTSAVSQNPAVADKFIDTFYKDLYTIGHFLILRF